MLDSQLGIVGVQTYIYGIMKWSRTRGRCESKRALVYSKLYDSPVGIFVDFGGCYLAIISPSCLCLPLECGRAKLSQ